MKSLLSSILVLLLTVILVFSFTACDLFSDGDDDDDDNIYNPSLADQLYEQGNNLLEAAMYININQNYGSPDVEELVLDEVRNTYNQAIEYNSNHSGAHFGLGVIDLVMLTREERFKSLIDDFEDQFFLFDESIDTVINPEFMSRFSGMLVKTPVEFSKQLMHLNSRNLASSTDVQQEIRSYILPSLNTAINHFLIVKNDSGFKFTITPRMQGDEYFDSIEIDHTDILAFLTAMYSLKATLHHMVAYNVDLGEGEIEDLNTALSPGSDFLTLHSTGAQDMASALSSWQLAVGLLEEGLNSLEAETDYQFDDLIFIDPYDFTLQQDIANLRQELPRINNLLYSSDEIEIDLDGDGYEEESITVSLYNFYSNPVEDWKAKLPRYSISLEEYDGSIYGYLAWEANSVDEWIFPDPTLNGFFPGMTNTRIIQLFLEEEGWTKYIDLDW